MTSDHFLYPLRNNSGDFVLFQRKCHLFRLNSSITKTKSRLHHICVKQAGFCTHEIHRQIGRRAATSISAVLDVIALASQKGFEPPTPRLGVRWMGHQVIPLSVYKSLQSFEIQGIARIYLCFDLGCFQLNFSGIFSFVGRNVGHKSVAHCLG